MSKIQIKNHFYNKIWHFPRAERLILCFLQQKTAGSQKKLGLTTKSNTSRLSKTCKNLQNATLKLCGQNVKIFEKIEYQRGKITHEFSDQIAELIEKSKGYFEVDLEVLKKLRSNKTRLLYEMFCQFKSTQSIDQFLGSFRQRIGGSSPAYRYRSCFKNRVFLPAIAELERSTSFRILRAKDGSLASVSADGKRIFLHFFQATEKNIEAVKYERKKSLYERLRDRNVPAAIAEKAVQKLGRQYVQSLIWAVDLDASDQKTQKQLNVLISKLNKALGLLEMGKNTFSRRKSMPKKKAKPKAPPQKKITYRRPPSIVYFEEEKGPASMADILAKRCQN